MCLSPSQLSHDLGKLEANELQGILGSTIVLKVMSDIVRLFLGDYSPQDALHLINKNEEKKIKALRTLATLWNLPGSQPSSPQP